MNKKNKRRMKGGSCDRRVGIGGEAEDRGGSGLEPEGFGGENQRR